MYVYPTILPQVSNREDFISTVSMFDDVTGDPLDLTGCTTAIGQPFTGAAWTVTSGATTTASSTVLTIPVFPISSASQAALLLFVGTNLALVPGAPVTIADPTGKNTMRGYVTAYTPATGALTVQIGMTFLFEIRRGGPRDDWDYVPYYDIGTAHDIGPLLKATLGQGISIIDIGALLILIPANQFQRLVGGTYTASLMMSDGVAIRQVFAGTVPVIQAHVSQMPFSPVVGPLWN